VSISISGRGAYYTRGEEGTRQYIFYFIVYSIHFLRMSIKVVDKSNIVKNDNKKRLSTFQQRLINFRD